jgi:crossover junction endodeoxyribonuclease RuvC
MRVLAIDPGYERIGIAVIERENTGTINERQKKVYGNKISVNKEKTHRKQDRLLFSECFKTPKEMAFSGRLNMIGSKISTVIAEFTPQIMAIEKLFFTSNQKTAMGVSEARGVIVYEATRNGLEICEYTPLQIKIAITGYGRSDKKQIIAMIPRLITITDTTKIAQDDEYDAIAAGITCLACYRTTL